MQSKKFLALSVIMLCAVGWIFAQPVVPFDFIIGAGMHMQFIDGEDPQFIMRARDDKRNYGFDGYMQGRYNFENKAGVDFRVEYGGGGDGLLFFRHYATFLWGRFWDRQIYLRGGYLTGGAWGGGDAGDFLKEEWGYELNITLNFLKGLEFGVLAVPTYNDLFENWKYITGFGYLLDGLFNLRFSYCNMYIAGRPGGFRSEGVIGEHGGGDGLMTAFLEIFAIPGVSFNVSTMVPDLGGAYTDQNGKPIPPRLELYQNLSFNIKGLTLGISAAQYNLTGDGLDKHSFHDHRKREGLAIFEYPYLMEGGNPVLDMEGNPEPNPNNPNNTPVINATLFISRNVGAIWRFGNFTPRLGFTVNYMLQDPVREYLITLTSPINNRAVAREIQLGYEFKIVESTLATRHDVWLVFMWRI